MRDPTLTKLELPKAPGSDVEYLDAGCIAEVRHSDRPKSKAATTMRLLDLHGGWHRVYAVDGGEVRYINHYGRRLYLDAQCYINIRCLTAWAEVFIGRKQAEQTAAA